MAGKVDTRNFCFPITLYYKDSETASTMGSQVPTFTDYAVFANIEPLSDSQRYRLGININDAAFTVTCVKPVDGIPNKLDYNSETYMITSFQNDRLSDIIRMTATIQK